MVSCYVLNRKQSRLEVLHKIVKIFDMNLENLLEED